MTEKLNMQDLIDRLITHSSLTQKEAETFVQELYNVIEQGLTQDELVKVKDFGTFKLTPIQERESVDVNTGEKIVIPAHRRVSFLPASSLKNLVNKPFAHFETTPLNDDIILENVEHDTPDDNVENEEEEGDKELREEVEDKIVGPEAAAVKIDSDKQTEPHPVSAEPQIVDETDLANIESLESEKNTNSRKDEEKSDLKITPPLDNPKKSIAKRKRKRSFVWIYISTALIVIAAIIAAYNFYNGEKSPVKEGVPESEIPKPIEETAPVIEELIAPTQPSSPEEPEETVKMTTGRTLRLIALDKFGSREFWVYIYLKNKDKIKNPDVIPAGIELVLPRKTEYPMDAENPEDVAKAKKLGDEEMKKFW